MMKSCLRKICMGMVRLGGATIHDVHDGEVLGKAFIIPWAGRVHLIGYEGVPLRMVCIPQQRIRYWRITIGFAKAEVPDFECTARG